MQALGDFAKLSLRTKAILALAAFGFTQREIAAVTKTSEPTVSRVMNEAARHVRSMRSHFDAPTPMVKQVGWRLRQVRGARACALALHLRGFDPAEIASVLGITIREALGMIELPDDDLLREAAADAPNEWHAMGWTHFIQWMPLTPPGPRVSRR